MASNRKKLVKLPETIEIEEILKETKTFEWFDATKKLLKNIKNLKSDFKRAIVLLNPNAFSYYVSDSKSFLDFAILMALHYL